MDGGRREGAQPQGRERCRVGGQRGAAPVLREGGRARHKRQDVWPGRSVASGGADGVAAEGAMSSEYLEVPLKPPSPPKHVLEVLKGYLLEHDERARMIGYLDGTDIP